ncbi:4-oxalomesaconate tautomerase [Microbacterium aurum]|uniref:4-oxalomesaconate tautomerase n=1 Tax=Microbacterium aurum TaxID=36805 RepID=A0A1P8U732_9MICO|nr:4-oxalomesaconate tautomerase [Microbacterium aurum]APZ33925.1 4-oxalomesaconate tautomerase [Microbacterium aurum]MBM7827686.1 4-oxalomesaconate tautomerase [Microbacterium aurum]
MSDVERIVPCAVMRGGTSKGLYFLAADLPEGREERDRFLLAAMGSPDPREIDGMGGGHPLTSKVAVVSPSERPGIDVDYLFLQVWPDRAEVSDQQNCGNILAGVGPFAIEYGLVPATNDVTAVRIFMVNTDSIATALVQTPGGKVQYAGSARIDGVPGTHAPIMLDFEDVAGSSTGALLPTGNAVDLVDGVEITCIDNGMPVVCLDAADFGITGYETPAELEANSLLRERVEAIRLAAGRRMNLGEVADKTVPKMSLLAPARDGGLVSTRMFIPHRVHESIGVLGAVSVATACMVEGSVAARIAGLPKAADELEVAVEHPTGEFTVQMQVDRSSEALTVAKSALLRTARLLMTGEVHALVPAKEN